MNRRIIKSTSLIIAGIIIIGGFISDAYSNPSGYTQRTSTSSAGCGSCHGSSANTNVIVSVVSGTGSFTVSPGSTTSFTVTVSTSLSKSNAGINLGVKTDQTTSPGTNIGTLTAGTGTKISNNEITQSSVKALSGGSASWTFSWTAPTSPGTYYMRAVGITGNGNGSADANDTWNWMPIQTITVTSATSITLTSPNGTEELCAGKNHLIKWNYSGFNNVRLELSSDAGATWPTVLVDNFSAATRQWSWPIPMNQTPGTNYMVRALDASNYATRDASNSTFIIHAATIITQHPADQNLCEESTAVFNVSATGENLQYYWKKNGVEIANENSRSLYLNNISTQDTGYYSCLVVGLCDSLSSTTARLTLKPSPKIVAEPKDDTVCIGSAVQLLVEAIGSSLNYSWSRNGVTIPNSNKSVFIIANVTRADSGYYECTVSGSCLPKVTSRKAVLMVVTPVTITQQPANVSKTEGDSAIFECNATGSNLIYQWRQNSVPMNGKTTSKLVVKDLTALDSGNSYDCVVSNFCGNKITKAALLTVTKPEVPEIQLSVINLDFGTVTIGTSKDTVMSSFIKNISKANLTVNSITITGRDAADFAIVGVSFPFTLEPQESRSINLQFFPGSTGAKTATLNFSTNSKNVVTLSMIGYSQNIEAELTATDWDFGTVKIGENPISGNIIKNIGTTQITIQTPTVVSYDSLNFKLLDAEKYPVILKPNDMVAVNFMFVPTIAKSYEVTVLVPHSGKNTLMFKMKGNGIINSVEEMTTEAINIRPNPASDYIEIWNYTGEIKILNILGQEMLTGNIQNSSPERSLVDISEMKAGIYLLQAGKKLIKFVIY